MLRTYSATQKIGNAHENHGELATGRVLSFIGHETWRQWHYVEVMNGTGTSCDGTTCHESRVWLTMVVVQVMVASSYER